MVVKRLAGIAFAIAFLMAIVLFGGYGRTLISYQTAQLIFIVAGAVALVLNLFTFQSSKHNPAFSFIFWVGSIVLFLGLVMKVFHFPYARIALLIGLLITGASFFIPGRYVERKSESDLLDDL